MDLTLIEAESMDALALDSGRRALVHRGGLRADVLAGGVIRAGDEIRPIES